MVDAGDDQRLAPEPLEEPVARNIPRQRAHAQDLDGHGAFEPNLLAAAASASSTAAERGFHEDLEALRQRPDALVPIDDGHPLGLQPEFEELLRSHAFREGMGG